MGTISDQAAILFRDYNSAGVPSSGIYNPDKALMIALLQTIDTMLTGSVAKIGDYVLTDSDRVVRVDASGAARTITINPALEMFTRTIVKTDNSTNEVIITSDGSTPLITLTQQGASMSVTPNGASLDFS